MALIELIGSEVKEAHAEEKKKKEKGRRRLFGRGKKKPELRPAKHPSRSLQRKQRSRQPLPSPAAEHRRKEGIERKH